MTASASTPHAPPTATANLAPGADFSQDQPVPPPTGHEPERDCDCDDCDCPICGPGCC